jgi:hypothetical protein
MVLNLKRRRGIFWLGCTVVLYVLTCCDVSYSNHDYYTLIIGPLERVVDLTMTFFSAVFSLKVKARFALIISPIYLSRRTVWYPWTSRRVASRHVRDTTEPPAPCYPISSSFNSPSMFLRMRVSAFEEENHSRLPHLSTDDNHKYVYGDSPRGGWWK